jgi:hypothetical protein
MVSLPEVENLSVGDEILMAETQTEDKLNPDQHEVAIDGGAPITLAEPEPILYRCKKGHLATFDKDHLPNMMELRKEGKVTNRTRPICALCHIEWIDKMFGMDKVE